MKTAFLRVLSISIAAGFALSPVLPRGADAQPSTFQADSTPSDGNNLTVYLVTFGAGDIVWEKFGHNAIWIHDARTNENITYNWGMFSFNQPQFVRRFLSGDTHYWMQGFELAAMMPEYRAANRSVLAQELALTPHQRIALKDYLAWDSLPQNKYYRYDYFRDNCSTRVRDALDRALSGQIRSATDAIPTKQTYRTETARLTADDPPLYTGTMLALGHRADKPLSVWEDMFLPVPMAAALRRVTVSGPGGARMPIVRSERWLFEAERAPERSAPPDYLPFFIAAGLALGGLLIYLVRLGETGSRTGTIAAGILTTLWTFVSGFFGLVVLAAWLLTSHVFMGKNENLLQFNPLSLGLFAVVPFAIGWGKMSRGVTRLATLIAMLSLIGFVLQGVPGWSQSNGEIIALALPLNLATAWAVYRLAHYKRISRSSSADL
ncbi:MAG: DUF4105 domain-containing protein [Gemmatimonadaceae bacterium]|nr:DUF4105 domain-containing protein [Gemmatimonadaceae bacterium]